MHHQSEVTALHFIDPYPALLAADASGAICLWAVAPTRFPVRHTIVMNLSTMLPNVLPNGLPNVETEEGGEGGVGAVISMCSAGSILGGVLPGGGLPGRTPEGGKGEEERRGGNSSSSGSNGGNGGKEEGVSLFFGDDKGMVTAWFIPRTLLAAAGVDKVGVQRPSTYVCSV